MSAGGQDLNELVGVLNARLESRHIEATEQSGQIGDLKRELAELRTALNRLWGTDADDSHAVHCEWYVSSGAYCSCVGLTEITRLRNEQAASRTQYANLRKAFDDTLAILAATATERDALKAERDAGQECITSLQAVLDELTAAAAEGASTWASDQAERDALKAAVLDIDAHATPYGDIPDDPGYVGTYLVTAGALHRALGKIGHTAPKCQAEAELARIVTEIEAEWEKIREAEGATARDESVVVGIYNGLGIALRIVRGES